MAAEVDGENRAIEHRREVSKKCEKAKLRNADENAER